MELDAQEVINEYAKINMELNHTIILLKLQIKKLEEELSKKGNEE